MTIIHTTPAQREALRQRFADILIAPEVARINFQYGTFRLRHGGYDVIAASLATRGTTPGAGHGATRRMNVRVERMPPHTGAMYYAESNIIAVPSVDYGRTVSEASEVVHEATHAIFDYNRVRLSAFEEEGCAYIASAMYCLIFHEGVGTGASAIDQQAFRIADGLVAPHRLMHSWTNEVTTADMQRLIAAIRESPTYTEIRARRTGYRYRHDGGAI